MKKKPHAAQLDDKHTSRSKRSPTKQPKKTNDPNKIITHLSREIKMIYVGIDVHKMFLQVAAMDEKGKVLLNQRVGADHVSVIKFFDQFPITKTRCVMESSSVWYGLYMFMTEKLGFDVVVSNPYQTKAISAAKKKTDKVAAVTLADLLRTDYLPLCYVPDFKIVKLRQLVRHRQTFVKHKTQYKNHIHAITLQNGIKISGYSFSNTYIEQLRKIGDYGIDDYLEMIEIYKKNHSLDLKIKEIVQDTKEMRLLTTIPGIGNYSALVLMAEIGDIHRFSTARELCSYAGLVPSVRNSADKVMHGNITKRGSKMMRWILTEAVHSHMRYNPKSPITLFYNRIKKRRGTSKATVAAAAKLLRWIYHMLIKGIDYSTNYSQNH